MLLDIILRLLNHLTTPHSHSARNSHQREHTLRSPSEPIDRVHTNLVRKLLAVVNSLHRCSLCSSHILLCFFAKRLEVHQDDWKEGGRRSLCEPVRSKGLVGDPWKVIVLGIHDQSRIAQVFCTHNTRIQTCKIKSSNWSIICTCLSFKNRRALVALLVGSSGTSPPECRNHKIEFASLFRHLTENLDLLPALTQKGKGNPTRLCHLNLILNLAQLLHERVGELSILDTIVSHLPELFGVTLPKTSKHFLGGHIKLLILQKVLRDIVQRVRLKLVLALHILKEVKDVPASHGNHLELIVAECTARKVLLHKLSHLTLDPPPHGRKLAMNGCSHNKILEIKAKDVPTCDDVRIHLDKVLLERLEELLLSRKPLKACSLLEAQTLPIDVALAKLLGGHGNLKDTILWILGVWETPCTRITLNIERHDSKWSKVIARNRLDVPPVRRPQVHLTGRLQVRLTDARIYPASRGDSRTVHKTQNRINI